jgi:SAM-dependent methyltransferase
MTIKSLDLGCGPAPKNPFGALEIFGVDVIDYGDSKIKVADLTVQPIPFPDTFFDFLTAYDFIEHIPRVVYSPNRQNSFINLMNEVYRVLKVGGLFFSSTPAFPHESAFVDPTHVNIITQNTFPLYFDNYFKWARPYGFAGSFKILSSKWQGHHLEVSMQKVFTFSE